MNEQESFWPEEQESLKPVVKFPETPGLEAIEEEMRKRKEGIVKIKTSEAYEDLGTH